jgi:ribose transport system substrate-binding protein
VIGFGSEIFGAPVVTTITGNTFENGFVNGRYAGEKYYAPDEPINCGVVIGVMGNSTAESRVNGMMSGIIYGRALARGENISKEDATLAGTKLFKDLVKTGKFSSSEYDFNCLAWGEGMWTEEGGLSVTENIITAGGDSLNLILAENDFQGSGAAQAIRNYNLEDQVKILSPGNGMREFFPLIQDGIIISDGSHNGYAFATATIDMIKELANGENSYDPENLPSLTAFSPLSINGENWEEYWDDDTNNWYHKTPPLKILTIPELRQAILDGTYGN